MEMTAAYYEGNKQFTVKPLADLPPLEAGTVRLNVAYCGICGTDVHIYHGTMDQRVQIPQVIGHEVSGVVSEVGPEVTGFQVGEAVTVRPLQPGKATAFDNGYTHIGKNLKFIGIDTPGGMQASWVVPAYTLHKLPGGVSLKQAALIEPLAVACHDVRLSASKSGDRAVVLGGGPIGVLVALVARHQGAEVLVSEVNPHRLELIQSLGFETVNPMVENVVDRVAQFTADAMADVVFEVSGVAAAVDTMTQLLRVRGRAVMVAIHGQPKPVRLFDFFWKELQLVGARVYEPEDFEMAIALVDSGKLPLTRIITEVLPLTDIQQAFERIDDNPSGMKYLLHCNEQIQ
ncbi:zinc-dependent alcohol dehydrogenase [Parapedobacter indicus]|uniref:2-desacetyl-2-hydroxyethyl bacteriochlorophyllide A dehydrogenase n=1 Tax=Parapedobacter indicus TaxID=1477437 RepID=A0A1I3HHY8_9SPHI|nr:alcohol dehydrogenase catalytic domain-containing protein [Parapedobacter indicus]PPL03047.1 2-desacetyl-2-hydroxyethyl bacteriochlorophyllide A dehydrogenase [Parapedobacter indicus]SFI35346.1 2-desacetyl-2-hydroxyethyl bacteriochlorophyllide A dehydrogenase [Parapedobacter indicus]